MDDILFETEDDKAVAKDSDVSLDIEDTETEDAKKSEDKVEEEAQIAAESEIESEEEFNLDDLFDDIDDAKETIEKIEEKNPWENSVEISQLKQSLNNMEQLVKKLSNEKADLTYKVAEMEAFGSDSTDPKVLLLSRNLAKANDWDERSKTKVISVLKDMLYDLTWEDYEQNKIDKDIDLLSAVESYNSSTNPNMKSTKKQEDDGLAI